MSLIPFPLFDRTHPSNTFFFILFRSWLDLHSIVNSILEIDFLKSETYKSHVCHHFPHSIKCILSKLQLSSSLSLSVSISLPKFFICN
ncbi:hypothetical protein HanRHA438_Chr04g0173051 [Helianthus annuus]|nr:hypothetical protein HanHA300_Chr04g0134131 [Helianthus annuus]KAJ0596794.1 hypothetical protein HanHA89_Chr04g0147001 [Helianthus annuus]KAJ0757474.1 hypothetical protein HanLR1_Chr04g0139121 [Helianthus annuus]KAJ0926596.1 hypothetical protein HanRHA438_Chr04g0173051 [Helianthus annuus]